MWIFKKESFAQNLYLDKKIGYDLSAKEVTFNCFVGFCQGKYKPYHNILLHIVASNHFSISYKSQKIIGNSQNSNIEIKQFVTKMTTLCSIVNSVYYTMYTVHILLVQCIVSETNNLFWRIIYHIHIHGHGKLFMKIVFNFYTLKKLQSLDMIR